MTSVDEREAELARLLSDLGLAPKPAKVVAYLASRGAARSTELEKGCGLRQPEVSQITKMLREEHQWVVARPRRQQGKGRPVNEYRLEVDLADIVRQIEDRKRAEIDRDLARLDRLRNVASSIEF